MTTHQQGRLQEALRVMTCSLIGALPGSVGWSPTLRQNNDGQGKSGKTRPIDGSRKNTGNNTKAPETVVSAWVRGWVWSWWSVGSGP